MITHSARRALVDRSTMCALRDRNGLWQPDHFDIYRTICRPHSSHLWGRGAPLNRRSLTGSNGRRPGGTAASIPQTRFGGSSQTPRATLHSRRMIRCRSPWGFDRACMVSVIRRASADQVVEKVCSRWTASSRIRDDHDAALGKADGGTTAMINAPPVRRC